MKTTGPTPTVGSVPIVDPRGVPEAQPHVKDGLHQDLRPRHAPPAQVPRVAGNARGPIANLATEARAELGGDGLEGHRRGTRERPGLPSKSRLGEAPRRQLGDVPHVDEGHAPATGGNVQPIVVADVGAVGVAEVLGEEARSENRGGDTAREEVRLDRVVRNPDLAIGAVDRQEDDVLDARLEGAVDEHVERVADVRNGRRPQEEEAARPTNGGRVGRRVPEVERDGARVPSERPTSRIGIGASRDEGDAELAERPHDVAPHVAGGARDEDRSDHVGHEASLPKASRPRAASATIPSTPAAGVPLAGAAVPMKPALLPQVKTLRTPFPTREHEETPAPQKCFFDLTM